MVIIAYVQMSYDLRCTTGLTYIWNFTLSAFAFAVATAKGEVTSRRVRGMESDSEKGE